MRILTMALGLLCALATTAARSSDLPRPRGEVILSLVGAVDGGRIDLDLAGLESLGLVELSTETPFSREIQHFAGVELEPLLTRAGARGDVVRATALNAYAIDLPIDEIRRYPIIIATRLGGRHLTVRDKGPLWVVFPWSQYPELEGPLTEARSIWQLRTLDIR